MQHTRSVREIRRYRESLDLYLYSIRRQKQKEQQQRHGLPTSRKPPVPAFPCAKDAELHAAEEAAKAVAAVLTAAAALRGSLGAWTIRSDATVMEQREAVSSQPEAVKAAAEPGAPLSLMKLDIRHLAKAQTNSTALFVPDAPTSILPESCTIRLEQGMDITFVECFITGEDTHRTALAKLCRALNRSGAAVTASIETDPASGRIRLSVSGSAPGKANAFSLKDEQGNVIRSLGLWLPDVHAANAEYRINQGSWLQSPVNRIRLQEERLVITFHQTTCDTATIQVIPDTTAVIRRMKAVAAACSLLDAETTNAGGVINPTVARSLGNILSGSPLGSLGLRLEGNGSLHVEADGLASRIKTAYPQVEDGLNGPSGLLPKLAKLVTRMENAPAEALLDRSNKSFKRYANYMASLEWYSQVLSKGLLLNRLF